MTSHVTEIMIDYWHRHYEVWWAE